MTGSPERRERVSDQGLWERTLVTLYLEPPSPSLLAVAASVTAMVSGERDPRSYVVSLPCGKALERRASQPTKHQSPLARADHEVPLICVCVSLGGREKK